jgi:hypothetical protein
LSYLGSIDDKTVGGNKNDDGKLRYDLIPAYPMEQLAAVYTFGARKYNDNNWAKGIKYSRIIAALFRHFWAFVRGEDFDPESGLPHLAHCLWNISTLLYFSKYRPDLDDRFIVHEPSPRASNSLRSTIQSEGNVSSTQDTSFRDPRQIELFPGGTDIYKGKSDFTQDWNAISDRNNK